MSPQVCTTYIILTGTEETKQETDCGKNMLIISVGTRERLGNSIKSNIR